MKIFIFVVALTIGSAAYASIHGSIPPTPCTSTGIFDLSNTCNNIYFIGALK